MKISILLPYKENFSKKNAGAVSLFVNDLIKNSENRNVLVFGSTDDKEYLDKKYVNLLFKKSPLMSNSKTYVEEFLKNDYGKNSDIIEIHNRPSYINQISNYTNSKILLYFHNDPLSMSGSKTVKERNNLLEKVNHFIFNSKWSLNRFLIGMGDLNLDKKKLSVVYQCVDKKKINFKNKKNVISFIGKLNKAKGYDIFGDAVIKILNEHKNWKAIVIGNEPREKHLYNHKNFIQYGFKPHSFILKKLETTSISVISSQWNEPLGRTSIEACSRGSLPIITNKGGLPETSKSALLIKNLNSKTLYTKIDYLIRNKKILRKLQKKNYNGFKFTPKLITRQIDEIRSLFKNIYKINFIKKKKFKILHITNFNERHKGRLHYNTGRRLNNGFIRNNHSVFSLSDRDIIHNSKSLNDITGIKTLNKQIIEVTKTFKPEVVICGHADNFLDSTINEIKSINKNIKLVQWFLDPVTKSGPDYIKNKKRFIEKDHNMNCSFITTSPDILDFKTNNSYFIPNPSDKSFEILNNHTKNPNNDLFFAMSHGVHRGTLKRGKTDSREFFLEKLIKYAHPSINFDFYGVNKRQPIWGEKFIEIISNSKMGLNLSRGEPVKYYSSDRIAQLFGNGLLTFLDEKTCLNHFFSNKEAVFYKKYDDLLEKVLKYKRDNKLRKIIAKNGKNKYMKYFNSDLVSQYIIDKTFDLSSKNKYIWG